MLQSSYIPNAQPPVRQRMIDSEVNFAQNEFTSTFAYVAKARANIWVTAAVVLFIVGFIAGIIYVADPNIFKNKPESTYQPVYQRR